MLNKKYCPILLSMPRNGSTWVQSYIMASYKNRIDSVIPYEIQTSYKTISTSNEFFDIKEYPQLETKEKIHLIETLEKINLVVCHKVFANMFLDTPEMYPWFKEFYKDYNIILLRRRNIWKTYISLLFHNTIDKHVDMKENLHMWHGKGVNETKEDFPIILANKATSLSIETQHSNQRELVCAIILSYLEQLLRDLNSVIDLWLEFCGHLNKTISFKEEENLKTGIFKGINALGQAKIEIDNKTSILNPNESTYIPLGSKHRISNPGEKTLILIEVQSGNYLGEDDIIRYEDIYGRNIK